MRLARRLRHLLRDLLAGRRHAAAMRLIRDSGLFDTAWYLETYPDVAARGVDPLLHYVRHGAREGRDPNSLFSSSWYMTTYAQSLGGGDNPLADYIRFGVAAGRDPSPLFSTAWYLEANPDVARSGLHPLLHFLRHGMREGRAPKVNQGALSWMPSAISVASPHGRDAQRASFDAAGADRFRDAVRRSAGHARLLAERPLISVILPTRDRARLLPTAIASVAAQTYPHWELLIVDDGSTDDTPAVIAGQRGDPRIRGFRQAGAGVAAARNLALAQAKGELIAYLDSDNAWRADFLEIAAAHLLDRDLDLVYAAIEADDGWRTRYVGAAFDLDALRKRNYIDINVILHRRALYDARGGCDESLRRMSDWDLVLRYCRDAKVGYAPFIGCRYDARLTQPDRITVAEPMNWLYVVLAKHLLDWPGLRAAAPRRTAGLASIVIPVYGQKQLTEDCLQSLFAIDAGCPFEVVLVDNGSDGETGALLDAWAARRPEITLVRNWENLNFALGCNLGFAATRGDTVVFLNNDTVVTPGWLAPLVAALREGDVGAVQPKLLYPDGRVQSFGTVLGPQGAIPYELYRGHPGDGPQVARRRRLRMITAACMAMRATDVAALSGFDPMFINGQEDNDLCLRLMELTGKTCLVEPASVVVHRESSTPGRNRFALANRRIFATRWAGKLRADDAAIYAEDGFVARDYRPDVVEWSAAGLASFRPRLEPASGVASGPATLATPRPAMAERPPSIAIKIACPSEAVREEWGDYHFAESLARALTAMGCTVRIDFLRDWPSAPADADCDLVLRGLERFAPRPDRPALLWVISHPDLVMVDELREYTHVFSASPMLTRAWAELLPGRVETLLQCTDPGIFYPPKADDRDGGILFVGNSRNMRRPAVTGAVEAGLDVAVYGTRWETMIDDRHIKAKHIPNEAVGDLYRRAGVVLNDHWPDMRRAGILSNRMFDVLACGTPIVTDDVADMPAGFAGFIEVFGPDRPIAAAIDAALRESPERRTARRAFSDLVRRDHSFDQRAEVIVARARELLRR
jgi:glycosyltransferase involved in cell wall biosynthesis